MHVQTHILSGWCLGNLVPGFGPRERALCMVAAAAHDLDGVGIVGDVLLGHEETVWYWALHHKLGHALLPGVVLCLALTALSARGRRHVALPVYLLLFHLHLALDYVGSGPNWEIYYLWPFSDFSLEWAHAWPLFSWQNILAFAVLFCWTLWIARDPGRTPLEAWMPSLDRRFVAWLRGRRSGNLTVASAQPAAGQAPAD